MAQAPSSDDRAMNAITLNHTDPYTALGVSPGADMDEIKAAYRSRIKEVHPDRNDSGEARQEFQQLVESYRGLTDAIHRAESRDAAQPLPPERSLDSAGLQTCCKCGCVSAQPRHVGFQRVKSFLVWARRDRVEGIFCRDCADHAAARASLYNWAWGWWSLPGLIWTPMALLGNLFGGSKPPQANARMLILHAQAFLDRGQPDLARVVIEQAVPYAKSALYRRQIDAIRQATPALSRQLKSRWRPWSGGVFLAQALPLLALPVLAALAALIALQPWEKPVSTPTAGITVQPANIGDIRHVAVDDLKLRQAAVDGAPVLTLLDRFTTVQVVGTESSEWTLVRTPSGLEGWVPSLSLYAGSGALFKQEWCAANQGQKPQTGEVLTRRATGDNRLLIHNDGRQDAVVKLKTPAGYTVVSYYIPATYHVGVGGIPEGVYRIETSSGDGYSRACGVFTRNISTGVLPMMLTFKHVSTVRAQGLNSALIPEINVAPQPGDPKAPQYLSPDRFAADD